MPQCFEQLILFIGASKKLKQSDIIENIQFLESLTFSLRILKIINDKDYNFFTNLHWKLQTSVLICCKYWEKTEGFDRNIKLLARVVLLTERGQVYFVYFKSRTRFCAESSSKKQEPRMWSLRYLECLRCSVRWGLRIGLL